MALPDKPTKHIPRKQAPIGARKDGKVKIIDGETGKVRWRQGRRGFARDWDGDPIAQNYNRADAKKKPRHKPRMGKRPKHKPKMGEKTRSED